MHLRIILFIFVSKIWKAIDSEQVEDEVFPEIRYMNLSVDPCEDFYEYTCGNFKHVYPLPDGVSTIDHFTILNDELTHLSKYILAEPIHPDDPKALKKAKSAYEACIDLNYLDNIKNPELIIVKQQKGFPLIEINQLQNATTYSFLDVADAVSQYGIPMLFKVQAYGNPGNASDNLIYISSLDSTSLTPSQIRAEHVAPYEQFIEEAFSSLSLSLGRTKRSLQPFDIFLRQMSLKLRDACRSKLEDDQVFENLNAVVNFTRGVFTGGYLGNASVETINGSSLYSVSLKQLNEWTVRQFNKTLQLDWVEFFQHIFSQTGTDIHEETQVMTYKGLAELLYGILNMVRTTEDHVIKSFVMMRIFTHLAPDSDGESRRFIEEYFTSTKVDVLPRWEYCTRKLIDSSDTASISFATAYEYQLRHYNVNDYKKAFKLIQDLQDSYKEIIENTTWMDQQSKEKALAKFENMIIILGHPDISYDKRKLDRFYDNLRICKWDHYGNFIRLKAFKNAYQISQVAKRDRSFWEKSPFEANAYYNPPNNKIIFPLGMLHSVFFGNKNNIVDYARIGSIIGHEMTHGFDSTGMVYNADGVVDPWWSTETTNAFKIKANCFIDQYNKFYEPEIEQYVNGSNTINENIADNGGAREAYKAMKNMLEKNRSVTDTGVFTAEQLFFIGFGTMWCNNPSLSYLQKMHNDKHARSKFRVNGVVSNMEEFSKAFNCPTGSPMNPSNKCILW
ncbi:neprilysin-11-like [Diorhabda carinulata]|uniref:neprilysin-11-like n=1 Tax=Diorhabda carinulata TaxID=1163345 RepID=UPI0025A0A85F|nr:neprilysin-11-like [Diorhabda carinulata]